MNPVLAALPEGVLLAATLATLYLTIRERRAGGRASVRRHLLAAALMAAFLLTAIARGATGAPGPEEFAAVFRVILPASGLLALLRIALVLYGERKQVAVHPANVPSRHLEQAVAEG